jgi:sec-independent protein translocase protein TatC
MAVEIHPEQDEQEELAGQMTFLEHLEELRKRIIHSLIAVAVAFGVCWAFADQLYAIVSRPIQRAVQTLSASDFSLVFTKPTEPFNLELKLALLASIFLAAPFILGQVWLFIAPGLYKHERRYAMPFILSSSILFILGGIFGYFVAFPFALQFLISWGVKNMGLKAMISASDYFDLFIMIELGLGVVFEIPALIFVLARIGLVSGPFLLRNTRYAVLIAFVVAAVITPTTDIANMMVMAVPMVALYLLGVIVAYVFGKKRKAEADA